MKPAEHLRARLYPLKISLKDDRDTQVGPLTYIERLGRRSMRRSLLSVAIVGVAGVVAPTIASADPIYLMSTRRVFVELGPGNSVQELTAPDNGPFTATLTANDGINQATASLSTTLLPQGVFGFGVTSVAGSSLAPLAKAQLIVNFLLTSPHTYAFIATMDGTGSEGAYLAALLTGQSIFTVPGPGFANVIRQGALQPGSYQLAMSLTSQQVSPGASSFQVSLQLADAAEAPIPEPGTMLMVASGATLFIRRIRRRVRSRPTEA